MMELECRLASIGRFNLYFLVATVGVYGGEHCPVLEEVHGLDHPRYGI